MCKHGKLKHLNKPLRIKGSINLIKTILSFLHLTYFCLFPDHATTFVNVNEIFRMNVVNRAKPALMGKDKTRAVTLIH